MKTKPPPDRHDFASVWDEIDYLYHKLLYWLYQREDLEAARPYTDRLEHRLSQADPNHEAIFGEECWSLVCETRKDFRGAIKHRKKEISLIHQLHRASRGKAYEKIALKDYGYKDLRDRLSLLAILYRDNGDLDKAIKTLEDCKQLSQDHGVKFDSEVLLQEYQAEKQNVSISFRLAVEVNGHITSVPWPEIEQTTKASNESVLEIDQPILRVRDTLTFEAARSDLLEQVVPFPEIPPSEAFGLIGHRQLPHPSSTPLVS